MGWPRRIRTIAISQYNALKERLESIDAEIIDAQIATALNAQQSEANARAELADALAPGGSAPAPPRTPRTPEEIAGGVTARPRRSGGEAPPSPAPASAPAPGSALARHYRVLGIPDGADLADVEAARTALATRCDPSRFDEGSAEQTGAREIMRRVDEACSAIRSALDPTVGRFDKLEL